MDVRHAQVCIMVNKRKVKFWCELHIVELEPPDYNCPECDEMSDEEIRELKEMGWTDEDFLRSGWRKFEHVR